MHGIRPLPRELDPMTVPSSLDRLTLLTERLSVLRAERDGVFRDTLLVANGDLADRATNVEATIRLRLLDERIAGLELEIAESRHRHHTDGVVSIGDVVTVDLGEGDETYLIGSVEQASAGIDTITPGSPLGRAIVGAAVGATVTYEPRAGVTKSANICSVGELLGSQRVSRRASA
jgi:transcription elongation factor GreA